MADTAEVNAALEKDRQDAQKAAEEEARAKEKAAEKLAREEEAAKKKQWEEEKKEKLNSIKSEIDSAKDTLSEQEGLASELGGRANSFRITDSLTRIGGTSGYGGINESVQSSLAKLVDGVKSMAKNTASILEKLNTDYSATQAAAWA
jgi:chromosome segregation ATPase